MASGAQAVAATDAARSFDLDANPPAVTVKAAYSKRRRDDRQPIRLDLAELLRGYLAGKRSDAPALCVPDRAADMLKADMRLARARWIKDAADPAERRERRQAGFLTHADADGRVVDFHALRATYITMIVKGGASVKVAQELARHSDPRLTMNTYTRLGVHDLTGALDALPQVGGDEPQAERLRATGTDHARADAPGSARNRLRNCLRNGSGNQREPAQRGAMNSAPIRLPGDARHMLVLPSGSIAAQRGATSRYEKPPKGLEPLTCALRKHRSTN